MRNKTKILKKSGPYTLLKCSTRRRHRGSNFQPNVKSHFIVCDDRIGFSHKKLKFDSLYEAEKQLVLLIITG